MLQPLNSCEGYFSLPLACKLLPSTVGRAQQLLAKGRALWMRCTAYAQGQLLYFSPMLVRKNKPGGATQLTCAVLCCAVNLQKSCGTNALLQAQECML